MSEPRHGIPGGRHAHYRRGEKPCEACRLAHNARSKELRAQKRIRKPEAVCGTLAGYSTHRRKKEPPCDPCRQVQNAYRRQRNKDRKAEPPPVPEKDRALQPREPPTILERRLAEHTPEWMGRAACQGLDQSLWFPGRGQPKKGREGKQICWEKCPVRSECEEYAIETRQDGGIWGGRSFKERQAIRNERS